MSKAQWIKENLRPGELYAGLILGKAGEPDYHLILLYGEAQGINWKDAHEWAAEAGGELPTRCEQALLYANLKDRFQSAWYWSSEVHASDSVYAWGQAFYDGGQGYSNVDDELRARAVRRLPI